MLLLRVRKRLLERLEFQKKFAHIWQFIKFYSLFNELETYFQSSFKCKLKFKFGTVKLYSCFNYYNYLTQLSFKKCLGYLILSAMINAF